MKRPKFINNTVAANPKEYDFWVDLQEDPQGGVIKKYNVAEYKWEKVVSGTSNGGVGESPNDNEFKDYSAQVANNLFELTKPKEYGPINHFREKIDLKRPDSPLKSGILITCENEFYVQQYEYVLRKFIKEWKKNSDAYGTIVNKLKFYIAVPLDEQNTIVYESKNDLLDLEEDMEVFERNLEQNSIYDLIQNEELFHIVFHQKQEELDKDLYDKTSWFDNILKLQFDRSDYYKISGVPRSVIQTYPYANYEFRDENDYQNTQLSMFHKINDACDMYYQNGYDIIPAGTAVLNFMNTIDSVGPNYLNGNTLSARNAFVYCSTVLYDILKDYIFINIDLLDENKYGDAHVSNNIDYTYRFPYNERNFNFKNNVIKTLPFSQSEINLKPTEQFQLRYTSEPFIPNLFEYTSTDETVAKVNKRGLITAISPGSCKIIQTSHFSNSLSENSQIIPEYTIIVSNENNIESDYSNSKIFNNIPPYIFKPYNKTGVIKPTTIYITEDGKIAHSGEKLNIDSTNITQTVVTNLKEVNNTKEFSFNQQFCTLSNIFLNFGTWTIGASGSNSEIMLFTENNTNNPLILGFCTNMYYKNFIKDIFNINMVSEIGIQYVLFDKVGNSNIISPTFYNGGSDDAFDKLVNYYNEHEEEYSDYAYCAFNFVILYNKINNSEYEQLIIFQLYNDVPA